MSVNQFGRVDAENNVFVIDGSERKVGQYPGVPAEEALAYFVRKFEDLAAQVRILEQRVANKVDSHGMKKMAAKLAADLKEPAVVGDIADLRRRIGNLDEKISALVSEKHEATKEATAEALAARLKIAVRAEEIANQDAAKTQWKTSGAEMTALFEQWQQLQKSGPHTKPVPTFCYSVLPIHAIFSPYTLESPGCPHLSLITRCCAPWR